MPQTILAQIQRDGLESQKRETLAELISVDEENREAEFSFSSEYEVRRWWGVEVLGHKEGEVDLTRLNNGGAFLEMHNPYDQRGSVVKAWLGDDSRCYCRIKFSRSEKGSDLLRDFADGIRTQVSVGYMIHEMIMERQEGDMEFYRVTKWEPTEVSSVSIAADPSVGVGRSQPTSQPQAAQTQTLNPVKLRGISAMDPVETPVVAPVEAPVEGQRSAPAAQAPKPHVQVIEERGANDAQKIMQTALAYGATDLGARSVEQGESFEQFQSALTKELHSKRSDPAAQSTALDLDLPKSDLKRYSLINVVRGLATGNLEKHAAHELAISEAMGERMGKEAQGILVPYEVMGHGQRMMHQRQMAAGTAGKGLELIETELHSEYFIQALRQQAVLGGLGAQFLTGLVGNVDIPKQTGSATFYWLNEDEDTTDSDLSLATVQMAPRTLAGAVPITRRMMIQTSSSIEGMVRNDLLTGLAEALDAEGLATILAAAGAGAVDMTGGIDWARCGHGLPGSPKHEGRHEDHRENRQHWSVPVGR